MVRWELKWEEWQKPAGIEEELKYEKETAIRVEQNEKFQEQSQRRSGGGGGGGGEINLDNITASARERRRTEKRGQGNGNSHGTYCSEENQTGRQRSSRVTRGKKDGRKKERKKKQQEDTSLSLHRVPALVPDVWLKLNSSLRLNGLQKWVS